MPNWVIKIAIATMGVIILGFAFFFLRPRESGNKALIATAIANCHVSQEFSSLFSDNIHEIGRGKHEFPSGKIRVVDRWYARAYLHERYAVEMSFPFLINNDDRIELLDDPTFFFCELAEAEMNENGYLSVRHGETLSFDYSEWKMLVDSGGDFSNLGLALVKDSPVKNFELWREQ